MSRDERAKKRKEADAIRLEQQIREANRRRRLREEQQPDTLLERRGEEAKKRRRRPRREFEELPGGGVLYEDVLPVPAREIPESHVVKYTGFEFDFNDL